MTTNAVEEVVSQDGTRISLSRWSRPGRDMAIIVCPGFFQSKDTDTFQRMSRTLAAGCDVLAMDFRGHGRSSGLYTFSAREEQDLRAVLNSAKRRYRRLGILGFSMGAAIAINTLSRDRDAVRSLVAVSGPSDFARIEFKFWTPEAMRIGVQGLERGAGCRPGSPWLKKDRPLDRIRLLEGVPVLLVHGTKDVIVGIEHSRRLFTAAAHPKQLHVVPGGSHAEALFRDDPDGFIRLTAGWFSRTL